MKNWLKKILVLFIVFGWLFSSWPQIWENPRIPPTIPQAWAATATYDFNVCGTDCDTSADWWFSQDDVDVFPFAGVTGNRNDHAEATDAQYSAIATSNNTRYVTDDPGLSDEIFMWSEMKINQAPSVITQIDFTFEGYSALTSNFTIYVKKTGAAWEQTASWVQVGTVESITANVEESFTRSLTSNFSDYIGADGMLIWGVYQSISSEIVNIDYVGVVVTYTNNPPSLTVSQPDGVSDTVIAGQSYNITYDLSDSDSTATVDFYYDSNSSGLDGTSITGCQDQSEGTGATCSWNTTGMTPGDYYVYGIATDGVNPDVSNYSPGIITINAAVISVTITTDGNVAYGIVAIGASKSTIDLSDTQTARNDGNVTETFNIKGQDATGGGCTWTLASTNGNDQYVHQFCNDTDNDCANPPTNYTALTTSYQTLDMGIPTSGTVDFQLRITLPTESSCYGQQSVDLTIQAVQQ